MLWQKNLTGGEKPHTNIMHICQELWEINLPQRSSSQFASAMNRHTVFTWETLFFASAQSLNIPYMAYTSAADR